MFKKIILVAGLSSILFTASGIAFAADQDRDQLRDQDRLETQDRIYGSELMTSQERAEHRSQMRAATSAEARERIRNEHHERMKVRAKERGVTIPDEPPAMRQGGLLNGMGNGGGSGGGMGGGMGGGKR